MHWREAQAWQKAVDFFARAGDLAARRGAPRESIGCYHEALAALERMPEDDTRLVLGIDVRIGCAHVMTPLADGEQMAQYIREAEVLGERLGDPWRLVGDARRGAVLGHQVIAEGLDESRPGAVFTAPRQVLMRSVLGWSLIELGEFDEARRMVDEAIAITTGRLGPDPLIIALVADALLGLRAGDLDGAIRACARAIELGRDAGYMQFNHVFLAGGRSPARGRDSPPTRWPSSSGSPRR